MHLITRSDLSLSRLAHYRMCRADGLLHRQCAFTADRCVAEQSADVFLPAWSSGCKHEVRPSISSSAAVDAAGEGRQAAAAPSVHTCERQQPPARVASRKMWRHFVSRRSLINPHRHLLIGGGRRGRRKAGGGLDILQSHDYVPVLLQLDVCQRRQRTAKG